MPTRIRGDAKNFPANVRTPSGTDPRRVGHLQVMAQDTADRTLWLRAALAKACLRNWFQPADAVPGASNLMSGAYSPCAPATGRPMYLLVDAAITFRYAFERQAWGTLGTGVAGEKSVVVDKEGYFYWTDANSVAKWDGDTGTVPTTSQASIGNGVLAFNGEATERGVVARAGGSIWYFDSGVITSPTLATAIGSVTDFVSVAYCGNSIWCALNANGEVWRSIDNAVTWTLVSSGPETAIGAGGAKVIIANPVTGAVIVAGADNAGTDWAILRSATAGATWGAVDSTNLTYRRDSNSTDVYLTADTPTCGLHLGAGVMVLAGTEDTYTAFILYSTDDGLNWHVAPTRPAGIAAASMTTSRINGLIWDGESLVTLHNSGKILFSQPVAGIGSTIDG